MKFLIFIISIILVNFCLAQETIHKCDIEENYSKKTYKKYANIKTTKWEDIYLNKDTHYYKIDSTKQVTGYLYGGQTTLNYEYKGHFARQLIYYDTCKSKIYEVHNFFPKKKNDIHLEYYYKTGKIKKKTIIRKYPKTDIIINWDEQGKKSVERIAKPGRMY